MRILLAEDHPTNQIVALEILKKLGYQADAVGNGSEAIRCLREGFYDIVLMDCQMPEMDGFEATRRIRDGSAKTRNPKIPIIALTAHAIRGDRERCLNAGMSDYISKPIAAEELGETLGRWAARLTAEAPPLEVPDLAGSHPSPQPCGDTVPTASAQTANEARPMVFNPKTLLKRVMGDRALSRRVVEGFLADLPSQLAAIKTAIAQNETHTTSVQAHQLKGAASVIGAEAAQDVAAELERTADAQDIQVARRLPPA